MRNRKLLRIVLIAWIVGFALVGLLAHSDLPLLAVAEGALMLAATHERRRGP